MLRKNDKPVQFAKKYHPHRCQLVMDKVGPTLVFSWLPLRITYLTKKSWQLDIWMACFVLTPRSLHSICSPYDLCCLLLHSFYILICLTHTYRNIIDMDIRNVYCIHRLIFILAGYFCSCKQGNRPPKTYFCLSKCLINRCLIRDLEVTLTSTHVNIDLTSHCPSTTSTL